MIVVDTSAIIALAIPTDTFHDAAIRWRSQQSSNLFITTNTVLIESLGWIRYKAGKSLAIEIGINLLSSNDIRVERVTLDDEHKAWKLFQKVDGRGISMVDCTVAATAKRLGITGIFTFDRDFEMFGLTVVPG